MTTKEDLSGDNRKVNLGKVTLCMIVKDEEVTLAKCLRSVCQWVDDIVIVDTGSSDRTIEIAKQFTDRIYRYKWRGDFSAARNYAMGHAHTEWILTLDADDIVFNPQEIPALIQLAKTSPGVVGMYSHYTQDASTLQRRLQLFKALYFKWEGYVHENPRLDMTRCDRKGRLMGLTGAKQPQMWNTDLIILHNKPENRILQAAKDYLAIMQASDPGNWFGLAESYKIMARFEELEPNARKAIDCYIKAAHYPFANLPTQYISLCNASLLYNQLAGRRKGWTDVTSIDRSLAYAQEALKLDQTRAEALYLIGQNLLGLAEYYQLQGQDERGQELCRKAIVAFMACQTLKPPQDDVGIVWHKAYDELPAARLRDLDGATEKAQARPAENRISAVQTTASRCQAAVSDSAA